MPSPRAEGDPVGQDDVSWLGVGRMGEPMVERLLAAGHAVRVWNLDRLNAKLADLKLGW